MARDGEDVRRAAGSPEGEQARCPSRSPTASEPDDARQNLGLHHRSVCRFVELTADVPHNQILREVTQVLLRFPFRLSGVREQLAWNATHLAEVTPVRTSAEAIAAIRYDRLNAHYRSVHALARLTVRHLTFDLEAGGIAAPTFLLDMDLVYEEFLRTLTLERAKLVGLRAGDRGGLRLDTDGHVGIQPDIVLTDGRSVRAVIDAKYKPLAGGADVYQALASAKGLGLSAVALVYPEGGDVAPTTHRIRNDKTTILVRTIPVGHGGAGFVNLERRAERAMSDLIAELVGANAVSTAA
jgi:hypothetical protein